MCVVGIYHNRDYFVHIGSIIRLFTSKVVAAVDVSTAGTLNRVSDSELELFWMLYISISK